MFNRFSALLAVTAAVLVAVTTAAPTTLDARQAVSCPASTSPYCCSTGKDVRIPPIKRVFVLTTRHDFVHRLLTPAVALLIGPPFTI